MKKDPRNKRNENGPSVEFVCRAQLKLPHALAKTAMEINLLTSVAALLFADTAAGASAQ